MLHSTLAGNAAIGDGGQYSEGGALSADGGSSAAVMCSTLAGNIAKDAKVNSGGGAIMAGALNSFIRIDNCRPPTGTRASDSH